MENINMRIAEQKDIDSINKLLYQVHKIHADARPDLFLQGEKKYTDEELSEIITNQSQTPVFVAEFDLCCGYPYVVNRYFNTTLDDDGQLVQKDSIALGIALFKYFKIAQHGTARLVVSGNSADEAARGVTSVSLNTSWSFTNLADSLPGDAKGLAFQTLICDLGYLADNGDHIFATIDGKYLVVTFEGRDRYSVYLADNLDQILDADGNLLTVGLKNVSE